MKYGSAKIIMASRAVGGMCGLIELRMWDSIAITKATDVIMEKTEEGDSANPFLKLTNDEAQRLMDELWNCGLRPSEGTGSAGSLAATERHLADMKQIAFHCLKIGKDK
jgi:hypothetical protein